jgi:hypothetical protein
MGAHQGKGVRVDMSHHGAQVSCGRTEAKDAEGVVHPLPPGILIQATVGRHPATTPKVGYAAMHAALLPYNCTICTP